MPANRTELRRLLGAFPAALLIARSNARSCGNGADGESIALVCDVAEALVDMLDQRDALEAERDAVRDALMVGDDDMRHGDSSQSTAPVVADVVKERDRLRAFRRAVAAEVHFQEPDTGPRDINDAVMVNCVKNQFAAFIELDDAATVLGCDTGHVADTILARVAELEQAPAWIAYTEWLPPEGEVRWLWRQNKAWPKGYLRVGFRQDDYWVFGTGSGGREGDERIDLGNVSHHCRRPLPPPPPIPDDGEPQ